MKTFETLGEVTTPDGKALTLHRRGDDVWIYLDGAELMGSRDPGSERALAALGCAGLAKRPAPRVLVGGLGFGFTVRAVLEELPQVAEVVVAEKFPIVAEWNREVLGGIYRRTLTDSRVNLAVGDVRRCLAPKAAFDAILLDVDNGPSAWCLETNGWLYGRAGLAALFESLNPGGMLAVWSAFQDKAFVKKLRVAGFEARAEAVRSRGSKGTWHTIFLGEKRVPRRRRR
ncbi:MAG: hypothetical protein AAF481_00315 [Acidobacteriota bacterium]